MSKLSKGLYRGADGKVRCFWCKGAPDYEAYHDEEWGRPVVDDQRLFEKLCLEGFQSGLSWLTILRKREGFRRAFRDFEIDRVARLTERSVKRLLEDTSIVRHRGKIESVINNAKRAKELRAEYGSLAAFFWSFEPAPRERPKRMDYATLKALVKTEASTQLSKALKMRGWTYVGPTTMYALMQAMGIVNDHVEGCAFRSVVERERTRLRRPRKP